MSTVAFDTLKFVERLEAVGFTSSQAKAAASAFCGRHRRAIGSAAIYRHYKSDAA